MIKHYRLFIFVILISMIVSACGKVSSISTQEAASTPQVEQQILQQGPINTQGPNETITQAPVEMLSSGLTGLEFDTFIEESYKRILTRDPETVLELGLSKVYDTPTDQLTELSDEYIRQNQKLEGDVLDLLEMYDRAALTPEQQLTYDIYKWYLTDRVNSHTFMYDDYPINPTVFSVHLDLLQFFTDLRPMTDLQDAQDYVTSLQQVGTKLEQLVDGLKRREENGVILPRFLVSYILGDVNSMARSDARSTPYYTAFESRLKAVDTINDSDRQSLLTAAEEAIDQSVLPGYQILGKYLEYQQTVATNDPGVWKFPDGEAYYAYTLKHYTTTDLTADQIHEKGLQALEDIHAEMRTLFDQLGYPSELSLPELYSRLAQDSGMLSGDEIVKQYEEIISSVDQFIGEAFDLRPEAGVIVRGDPVGGYYTPPAVDGSRPGIFYAQDTGLQPLFGMPTLAYHETIPGHHYQIAIAQQLDLPSFRRGSDFTAYVEGWALYAEQLTSELGAYENDPYGDLGRLQARAFRAARLVVDTGLHSRQWTFDQAVDFMVENTGIPENRMQAEVSRYISLPGQATSYFIGYTTLMELRQHAMDQLGDKFDLKEFHNLVLGNGAMPLDLLKQVVENYIQSKLAGE